MIGQLLIAPPAQDHEMWEHSVIFIYEESQAGTIGLITNKPSERTLSEIAETQGVEYHGDEILYVGGPVNPGALVMLHTDEWRCSNTMYITPGFAISSDRQMLHRIATSDRPRRWKMFLGMSAWSTAQLEGEINGLPPWNKKQSWVTAPATQNIVFADNSEVAWKRSINLAAQKMVTDYFTI